MFRNSLMKSFMVMVVVVVVVGERKQRYAYLGSCIALGQAVDGLRPAQRAQRS